MFIEARDRLINLYLLQNMKKVEENDKYIIRFIFMNGEIYDESYDSQNEANTAFTNYKNELLNK